VFETSPSRLVGAAKRVSFSLRLAEMRLLAPSVLLALSGTLAAEAFVPTGAGPRFGLSPRAAAVTAACGRARLGALPALAQRRDQRRTSASGACVMQMTDEAKPGLAEPSDEMVQQALTNAVQVLKAAGGCIDSLSFGREWRQMFPDFPRDAFMGTRITSFNKLLTIYGAELFSVESTKKKEVKLYILKDSAGAEGREAYQQTERKMLELANSPLGVFFDIRGGRMRAGGARALPPNLSSYTKLDKLLDALEPNLVAFAGGVSVVSAKDAVTALNNIKRLQYQARWPVQQVSSWAVCGCCCACCSDARHLSAVPHWSSPTHSFVYAYAYINTSYPPPLPHTHTHAERERHTLTRMYI
jgi:hypothetical protein